MTRLQTIGLVMAFLPFAIIFGMFCSALWEIDRKATLLSICFVAWVFVAAAFITGEIDIEGVRRTYESIAGWW
jgi:biotin transporter BioY